MSSTLQEFEETFWRPFEDQLQRAAQESEAALYTRRGDGSNGDQGDGCGDDEVTGKHDHCEVYSDITKEEEDYEGEEEEKEEDDDDDDDGMLSG